MLKNVFRLHFLVLYFESLYRKVDASLYIKDKNIPVVFPNENIPFNMYTLHVYRKYTDVFIIHCW